MIDKPSNIINEVDGLVDTAFKGFDSLFTSDEERGQLKLATEKLKAGLDEKVLKFREAVVAAVSARHAADMKSDSWLAKNVRPLVLVTLTIVTIVYLFYGLNIDFPTDADELHPVYLIYKAGLGALLALDTVVYGFYFGSRGLEKIADKIPAIVAKVRKSKKEEAGELGW